MGSRPNDEKISGINDEKEGPEKGIIIGRSKNNYRRCKFLLKNIGINGLEIIEKIAAKKRQ